MEIYTFAAAANHFSVPYTVAKGQKRFVFGAVEHFANTRDYVAQIGEHMMMTLIQVSLPLLLLRQMAPSPDSSHRSLRKDALPGGSSSASVPLGTCCCRTSEPHSDCTDIASGTALPFSTTPPCKSTRSWPSTSTIGPSTRSSASRMPIPSRPIRPASRCSLRAPSK